MTYIVKRLRAEAGSCRDVCGALETANLMQDAADEIERLHHDRISGEAVITKLSFALKRDNAEIERLRAVLHEIKRCNEQYNFGSKLVRIVDTALEKIEP